MNKKRLRLIMTCAISTITFMLVFAANGWAKLRVTVQIPTKITFENGTNGSNATTPCANYAFDLRSQGPKFSRMKSVEVCIEEDFTSNGATYKNPAGVTIGTETGGHVSGQAFPSTGTSFTTGGGGEWSDLIHLGNTTTMDGYANFWGSCTLEAASYDHIYTSAFYQLTTYPFTPNFSQTQSWVFHDTCTTNFFTLISTYTYSASNIIPAS